MFIEEAMFINSRDSLKSREQMHGLLIFRIAKRVENKCTNKFFSSLHVAQDLPNHLLHSSGSASIHCPTVVDAHIIPSLLYLFFADGADHMAIPTRIYLHWWIHSFVTNWTFWNQVTERIIADHHLLPRHSSQTFLFL